MGLNKTIGTMIGILSVMMSIIAFYSPTTQPKHIVLILWIITIGLTLVSAYNLTREEDDRVSEMTNPVYRI